MNAAPGAPSPASPLPTPLPPRRAGIPSVEVGFGLPGLPGVLAAAARQLSSDPGFTGA